MKKAVILVVCFCVSYFSFKEEMTLKTSRDYPDSSGGIATSKFRKIFVLTWIMIGLDHRLPCFGKAIKSLRHEVRAVQEWNVAVDSPLELVFCSMIQVQYS